MALSPCTGGVQLRLGTRGNRGQFEHGQSGAANQRGNKITKQTQFRTTHRESMGCGGFPVRRDGRVRKTRRIAPPRYKGTFASGQAAPRNSKRATTDYRSSVATGRQNDQTNPIPHNCHRCRNLHDSSEVRSGKLKVAKSSGRSEMLLGCPEPRPCLTSSEARRFGYGSSRSGSGPQNSTPNS